MKVEQIYTGCLAQGAYYIVSEQEAVIIDPLREVQPYLNKLNEDHVKLKYIFETHFHADFVSGHLDLSEKTGASIVYGPTANPKFKSIIAKDEEIFEVGKVKIKVLHTPGHTLESSCYLLINEEEKEVALFSGDTLFLGDVGRPDLAQKGESFTQEDLSGMLYDSLMNKIVSLPDDIIVYPAHGAGSACGKNMQKETVDTLGNQKKTNYALNQPDKSTFIYKVTEGLLPPPGYFSMNVAMNKSGYKSFDQVLKQGLNPLSVEEFDNQVRTKDVVILDTRSSEDFCKSFILQSVNIGINGDFAPWVGAMIVDVKQPLLLVVDEGKEEEVITRLSRVGFDNVVGYLKGGITAWELAGKETDHINRVTAEEFSKNYLPKLKVIDVRKEGEYAAQHVENACNFPLSYINTWIKHIDSKEHFFLYCAGGYRSMIAASILRARGYKNFTEVEGGFNKIKTTRVPTTNFS